MKKHSVLVFPCGSEIGLEIYKSLAYSLHVKLVGGSSVDDHGKFVYQNYIDGIPFIDDPGFSKKLNEIIDEKQIDFILPSHDSVVLKLAKESAAGKLRCKVVTSPVETCEVARSKKKTYEVLKDTIATPVVYDGPDDEHLPLFLKPDVGQGSKGTVVAHTLADIEYHTSKDPSLLILENLPGKEYTIDCFTDRHGDLRYCEGRQRVRVYSGISVNSVRVKDQRFRQMAEKISGKLVFRGVWFFQVKERADGELVLMEVAPRVAGAMGFARCKGVNLPLLSIFDAMEIDIDILENSYDMIMDRALDNRYRLDIDYEHVYLDLDDLVVFDGRINTDVMAFVFQCINKNTKIHLITRHKGHLEYTLKGHRLNGLFDELIWVREGEDKVDLIKPHKAIYIDDSYAERKRVYDIHKIPVFDSHMLEGLMEAP